jgi:hypothetical protein
MIAKVETQSGKGFTSFAVLDSYIERFEAAFAVRRSPLLDSRESIPEQMDGVARKAHALVRNPAYHFVLSWDRGGVSQEKIWATVDRALSKLGCSEHQWVAAHHIDTTHDHVHVLVNRVHPQTHKAWSPQNDYYKLQELSMELEPFERSETSLSSRAADFEIWSGQQSMQTWTRERVMPAIREILKSPQQTWEQLHGALGNYGLRYDLADGVAQLVDRSGKAPRFLKARAADPILTLEGLEERLGRFTPPIQGSLPKQDQGYGALVERFALPAQQMLQEKIRPLYDRFVRERLLWKTRGRYEAAVSRQDLKASEKADLQEHRDDVRAAYREIEKLPAPERSVSEAIIERLDTMRQEEIRESYRRLHKTINYEKPAALFRRWLKEKVNDGDPSAGVALDELRKLRSHKTPRVSLLSEPISQRPGAPVVDAPTHEIDKTVEARLADALRSNVPSRDFSDELLAIAEETHERVKQTSEYLALVEKVETIVGSQTTVDREIVQHALVAVAGLKYLTESEIRLLYEPLEAIAPYADYGPEFAAKVDEAHFVHVESIVNSEDAQIRDVGFSEIDGQSLHLEDDELASGSISAGELSRSATDDLIRNAELDERQSQEIVKYRDLYDEYVKTVGLGLFEEQRKVYTERRRAIDQAYSVRKAEALELEKPESFRERSKAMGWKLRTEARLLHSYRIEESILEDLSGEEPPKSFHRFLVDFGTPEAINLAKYVEDRPTHMTSRDVSPVSPMADVAAHLSWSDLDDGKVQYKVNGRAAFVDSGKSLDVRSSRDKEAAAAALMMANMKFGGLVKLEGSNTYKRLMLRQAVEMGIEVTNPELQDLRAAYIAEHDKKLALEKSASENARKPVGNETRSKIDDIFRDTAISRDKRREKVDEIIVERAVFRVAEASKSKVGVAEHGLTIDGTLEDVLMFNRRAYAVVRTSERGAATPTILAPITKEAAKQIVLEVGKDVRGEHIGVGNLYDLDTDIEREIGRVKERSR